MDLRQPALKSPKSENTKKKAERKRQLKLIEATYINNMLGNRFANLLVNNVDVLNAQPQIPTTFTEKKKKVE
ncbi:hypothetical protein B597_012665 [Stutzerimonas stutzeri KOS6]|uniref:Uncharacterized protein n=1 Tax=Stutzerimonas stutzeri KOS6 TaxID=1218352 RepID=A0A061JR92_STUST|nr:hypothetical protein B597_012665 [Stutzerimonas stutzeri KOS6]